MASGKTNKDMLDTTKQVIRKQTDKKTGKEESELEKRYQEIIRKIKEKAEAANKELSQSKETPMKQKKAENSTSKKCRKHEETVSKQMKNILDME